MKIIKRDGHIVDYEPDKIRVAINKANNEVRGKEKATKEEIEEIIKYIEDLNKRRILVEDIQDIIEEKLMGLKKFKLAKEYITYRYTRALVRKSNTTDESILSLIRNSNKELAEENSNKCTTLASTQRDYIAGEVSRDLTRRILLPEKISKAHDEGILHFHDADYFIQPIFNCCLINIGDMLDNGTVMNGKMIESPKSFQVACTVTTQIIAAVASNQYGGQSVDLSHLGKYVRLTKEKFYHQIEDDIKKKLTKEEIDEMVMDRLKNEVKAGVQTMQYQINTLMTTNGQAPFVTLFMHLKNDDEYIEENAMIFEEVIRQRLEGIKNEKGVYVTPAFPKLVYVLDENNCLKGGKYDYLTRLAIKCSAKRMYPDYISAKEMRKNYEGNVFSPMGCRSFLSPWKDEDGNYKFEGRFNQGVVSINLPQVAIVAEKDEDKFWSLLDERLELCKEALLCRHEALLGTTSDISPIHWQYGAIARLKKGEKIDKYLNSYYSTISLGYIGVYETTKLMRGVSHTDPKGEEFALKLMHHLRDKVNTWKKETGLGFALYGTPAESLCGLQIEQFRKKYGIIENVSDRPYVSNSFHCHVSEDITPIQKQDLEERFWNYFNGGKIQYCRYPVNYNKEAVITLIKRAMKKGFYEGVNLSLCYCEDCGHEELDMDICPVCGSKTITKIDRMNGYLGFTRVHGDTRYNAAKNAEIKDRKSM